jgi:hypothetical protein
MFFHINEKTLKDVIENQKKRDEQAFGKSGTVNQGHEIDGHVLQFFQGVDGSVIIESTPPLIKEIEGDKNAQAEDVDKLTPSGWVPVK